MACDVVNEASALAQADVGISMDAGASPVAIEATHVVRMREASRLVPNAAVKKQRRGRAMESFSGLDVSMERTAMCVVDDKGEVQMQSEVVTDPNAIAAALKP